MFVRSRSWEFAESDLIAARREGRGVGGAKNAAIVRSCGRAEKPVVQSRLYA